MANPDADGIQPVSLRVNQSRPGAAFQLDELSKAIIEKLQQDGRRSYAGIGKAVGLSEAAVRQRVQRMVDAGVMQIVAVTDPMQLGFARQAMIGIRCTGDTTKVAEKLAAIDVRRLRGADRGLLRRHRRGGLRGRRRPARPAQHADPRPARSDIHRDLVYLKLVKQQYNWGTR